MYLSVQQKTHQKPWNSKKSCFSIKSDFHPTLWPSTSLRYLHSLSLVSEIVDGSVANKAVTQRLPQTNSNISTQKSNWGLTKTKPHRREVTIPEHYLKKELHDNQLSKKNAGPNILNRYQAYNCRKVTPKLRSFTENQLKFSLLMNQFVVRWCFRGFNLPWDITAKLGHVNTPVPVFLSCDCPEYYPLTLSISSIKTVFKSLVAAKSSPPDFYHHRVWDEFRFYFV